jgi:hypothetical protein
MKKGRVEVKGWIYSTGVHELRAGEIGSRLPALLLEAREDALHGRIQLPGDGRLYGTYAYILPGWDAAVRCAPTRRFSATSKIR